jgi:hypothetical protein
MKNYTSRYETGRALEEGARKKIIKSVRLFCFPLFTGFIMVIL